MIEHYSDMVELQFFNRGSDAPALAYPLKKVLDDDVLVGDLTDCGRYEQASDLILRAVDAALHENWGQLADCGLSDRTCQELRQRASNTQGKQELRAMQQYARAAGQAFRGLADPTLSGRIDDACHGLGADAPEFLNAEADMLQRHANALREDISAQMQEEKQNFSANAWASALKKIDQPIGTSAVGEYLADVVRRAANGELRQDDPEAQKLMQGFSRLMNEWGTPKHQDLNTMLPAQTAARTINDGFLQPLVRAFQAAECSREQDLYNEKIQELTRETYEIERKLELDRERE